MGALSKLIVCIVLQLARYFTIVVAFSTQAETCASSAEDIGVCKQENYNLDQSQRPNKLSCHIDNLEVDTRDELIMAASQNYVTTLASIKMPKLIYGTAWKKERTSNLVMTAIRKGFRGIDTACQKKHYNENGVGDALRILIANKEITREDIFLQTKFTSVDGQDPKTIPYDPQAKTSDQVVQSLQASLKNLGVTYIDSLVLHSPMKTFTETLEVWRVFESFVKAKQVRQLGISNCYDLRTLTKLFSEAEVKPAVIQNRFYQESNYDVEIRQFAAKNHIYYQSFWTLSANPHVLRSAAVQKIAKKYEKTPEQIFFAYLINSASNITPLTGTTNEIHMVQDLEALNLTLTADEAAVFDSFFN